VHQVDVDDGSSLPATYLTPSFSPRVQVLHFLSVQVPAAGELEYLALGSRVCRIERIERIDTSIHRVHIETLARESPIVVAPAAVFVVDARSHWLVCRGIPWPAGRRHRLTGNFVDCRAISVNKITRIRRVPMAQPDNHVPGRQATRDGIDLCSIPLKDLCDLGGWKNAATVLTCSQQPGEQAQREGLEQRRKVRIGAVSGPTDTPNGHPAPSDRARRTPPNRSRSSGAATSGTAALGYQR
jgi:hypothetical protein